MAPATIAWSALLAHLAQAGLTITNRLPDYDAPPLGWFVRLLDDSLDWDGPHPDPLAALDHAVRILLVAYKAYVTSGDDALYWEMPVLLVGDHVTVDGVKGSWTVTQLLDDGYVRVRERLRGTTIDVERIRCLKDEDNPPRATTA